MSNNGQNLCLNSQTRKRKRILVSILFYLFCAIFFVLSLSIVFFDVIANSKKRCADRQLRELDAEQPKEENRIYSRHGFSVIKPNSWNASFTTLESASAELITLTSNYRQKNVIQIICIPKIKDKSATLRQLVIEKLPLFGASSSRTKHIKFQNKDAIVFGVKITLNGSVLSSCFCLAFESNEFVYFIRVSIYGDYDNIPANMMKFIRTFKAKKESFNVREACDRQDVFLLVNDRMLASYWFLRTSRRDK